VRTLVIILLGVLLVMGMGYLLLNFYNTFYAVENYFVKAGIIVIFIFTLLVVLRYMSLLFFSIFKILFQNDNIANRTFKTEHKVTVIVPAYNEEKTIATTIESIKAQTYPNLEILVVDDGSSDQTYAQAKLYEFEETYRSLRVLRKTNGGKASAINYGIHRSQGDLIMVVDADSRLEKDAVMLMVQYFYNPEIAAVAGSVYVSNQNNIWTKLQALEYIEGLNMVRNGQAFLKMVNIIPGPIGMFRKTALYKVGLYDNDTFAEDCDVTLKLISGGYKVDFESDAVAYTEAPENLLDLIKQRYRWTRGILQAIKKHKWMMVRPTFNPAAFMTMWYMLFEAVLWPFMDVWANIFVLYTAIVSGFTILIVYWWSMFTIIDVAGALFCILVTGEKLSLVWYAIFYRLFFIQIINLAKIFSTFEEWFNLKMSWGKLERKGHL